MARSIGSAGRGLILTPVSRLSSVHLTMAAGLLHHKKGRREEYDLTTRRLLAIFRKRYPISRWPIRLQPERGGEAGNAALGKPDRHYARRDGTLTVLCRTRG